MENNNIIKVRVVRSEVKHFPFDVFYLVSHEQRELLPKLFKWSLCLIMGKDLIDLIIRIPINSVETMPLKGRTHIQTLRNLKDITGDLAEYFLLVPILPTRKLDARQYKTQVSFHELPGGDINKIKELSNIKELTKEYNTWVPSYITAPRHAGVGKTSRGTQVKNTYHVLFDERTVLFTPERAYRPPCAKCSRHLLYLQGKCSFACKLCWNSLVLKGPDEQLSKNNSNTDIAPSSDTDAVTHDNR